jgi:hypothetical protein
MMSRELRATLAIMLVALIAGAPLIFAEPNLSNKNYLAMVFNIVPTLTPQPTATNTPQPTSTPQPTATPTLPPPSYNNCQADPNPNAAPNYPLWIVAINKVGETVEIRNVSNSNIDLSGWQMCSVTGNQHHPISGIIGPGAIRTFFNNGGPIWNNSSPDPGALYNPNGQLVSYFNS